jgi:hypothetical protein
MNVCGLDRRSRMRAVASSSRSYRQEMAPVRCGREIEEELKHPPPLHSSVLTNH